MKPQLLFFFFAVCSVGFVWGQDHTVTPPDTKYDMVPTYSNTLLVVGYQEKTLDDKIVKAWQHKDIIEDTIPGISSDKAHNTLLKTTNNTVIVAVLDSGVDIDHEDLKGQIWTNQDEIPNNNIDDDHNGYIDDIHGWNFLGNTKGENINYTRWEFVRILKDKGYFNKGELHIPKDEKDTIILSAAKCYTEAKDILEEDKAYVLEIEEKFAFIKKHLNDYFPNHQYSFQKLKEIDTTGTKDLKKAVETLHSFLKYELTEAWIQDYQKKYVNNVEDYNLNPDYNDRKRIGDHALDINDTAYGNANVIGNKNIDSHGTLVSGIIGAVRNNDVGINGIADNVQLMPIRVIPKGDEYDKDVALAIRYAVDNGAKVINMSFGKFFSPQQEWVMDAIQYAAKNDVLIIHAAGNDNTDIDRRMFYPNDQITTTEISDTFVNVGALHYKLNHKLVAYFSNYGKTQVDIFAPGYNIHTTAPNNTYRTESGTSFAAPIVSGIAALLRSRYQKLKASQIKNILMSSGNSYNIKVRIPGKKKNERTYFSELSKSGKVVNAYNALLMADEMSRQTPTN